MGITNQFRGTDALTKAIILFWPLWFVAVIAIALAQKTGWEPPLFIIWMIALAPALMLTCIVWRRSVHTKNNNNLDTQAAEGVEKGIPDIEGLHALLKEIAVERARQDSKWGGAEHDDQHTTADFVQLIQDYAGWSRVMAGKNSPDKARLRLIQVAALALAAVESIDRKAAVIN